MALNGVCHGTCVFGVFVAVSTNPKHTVCVLQRFYKSSKLLPSQSPNHIYIFCDLDQTVVISFVAESSLHKTGHSN